MPQGYFQFFGAVKRHWRILFLKYYSVKHCPAPLEWQRLSGVKEPILRVLECHCHTVYIAINNERKFAIFFGLVDYILSEENSHVFYWLTIWSTDNFACNSNENGYSLVLKS